MVPTPESTGLPGTRDAQAQRWWDGRCARPMPGEAGTSWALVRVRGFSWRAGPGRALGTGVGTVLPGPAASTGLPGSAGLLSIVPAASSEPSPERELPGRRGGEVGWRGAGAGAFTPAALSRTGRPRQVSDNGTQAAPRPASLQEQTGGPVADQEPLGR